MANSYYQVGEKRFLNAFLAYYESYQTNQKLYCYIDEEEFDRINWKQEPELDLETLMDQKAKHLREKYDVLVFYWSGGTDSQTLFNVFKRNNIFLDRIVICCDEKSDKLPGFLYNWILRNHYDPRTVIYQYSPHDVKEFGVFDSASWVTHNSAFMPVYQRSGPSDLDFQLNSEWYPGKNFAMVSGHEKPDLVFENNTWYTRYDTRALRQCIGRQGLEAFFIDPLIQSKQSHIFKRAIKARFPNIKNGDTAIKLYNIESRTRTALQYHDYCTAHGRHQEVRIGMSHIQKKLLTLQYSMTLSTTGNVFQIENADNFSDKFLVESLKVKDERAINYLRGLQDISHDIGFMEYMNKNILAIPDRLMTNRALYSKAYDIGA